MIEHDMSLNAKPLVEEPQKNSNLICSVYGIKTIVGKW